MSASNIKLEEVATKLIEEKHQSAWEDDVMRRYVESFKKSLNIDPSQLQAPIIKPPIRIEDICSVHGTGIDSLRKYKIILDWRSACDFLRTIGNGINPNVYRARFHKNYFKERFGYEPTSTDPKRGIYVYTYAQTMHLVKEGKHFELPERLVHYLDA